MSVVVVGLQQPQAPLALVEQMAVGQDALPKALAVLKEQPNIEEAVLISTCLRTEVYAVVDRFHDGVSELQQFLAELAGTTVEALSEFMTCRFDDDVAVHLFEVASGLDSVVPGEPEVLGQVRRAWEKAHAERAAGPVLSTIFRHAIQTGKRVRSETAISEGITSLSHAAVSLASQHRPGGLAGARVLVVGAGEMGEGVVRALASHGPCEVVVANRTLARASQLIAALAPELKERSPAGAETPARAVPLSRLEAELVAADVAVFSVEAFGHFVDVGRVMTTLAARKGKPGHPLVIVDLGVPRNVDPAVGDVPGVSLFDMDDLRAAVEEALAGRHDEKSQAHSIVTEEVDRYRVANRARGAAPAISALRTKLEAIREGELARFSGRLGVMDQTQLEQVDALTRAIVAKVLHEPTVVLREAGGTPRGERLVETLRSLFDL